MKDIIADSLTEYEMIEAYKAALKFLKSVCHCPSYLSQTCRVCPFRIDSDGRRCIQIETRKHVDECLRLGALMEHRTPPAYAKYVATLGENNE